MHTKEKCCLCQKEKGALILVDFANERYAHPECLVKVLPPIETGEKVKLSCCESGEVE